MSILDEKLAGVDGALADLGRSDEEVDAVRQRFANRAGADLEAVDAELRALSESAGAEIPSASAPSVEPAGIEDQNWDDEETEVEVLDESDFVLLVDEDDLEELEKVGEDDAAATTTPPALPTEGERDGDSFFKKLFGGRRSRPPQP